MAGYFPISPHMTYTICSYSCSSSIFVVHLIFFFLWRFRKNVFFMMTFLNVVFLFNVQVIACVICLFVSVSGIKRSTASLKDSSWSWMMILRVWTIKCVTVRFSLTDSRRPTFSMPPFISGFLSLFKNLFYLVFLMGHMMLLKITLFCVFGVIQCV